MLPKLLPRFLVDYPALMIGAIMLLLILPSLIGVHRGHWHRAGFGGDAGFFGPQPDDLQPGILTGWLIAIMVSPFSANNLMLAGFTGRPSWSISLGLNAGSELCFLWCSAR